MHENIVTFLGDTDIVSCTPMVPTSPDPLLVEKSRGKPGLWSHSVRTNFPGIGGMCILVS